ncbi:MAG: hypothetical protein ACJAXY_000596, partial [Nonlabens sp.]
MKYLLICAIALLLLSCNTKNAAEKDGKKIIGEDLMDQVVDRQLTKEFKEYWYNGTAEIS